MRRVMALSFVLAIALTGMWLEEAIAGLDDPFRNLPARWKIVSTSVLNEGQATAIAQKLGGRITELSNTILSVDGVRLQVNIIRCPSAKDADAIHKAVLDARKLAMFCLRVDDGVVEFVGDDIELVKRVHYVLGFRPRDVTYRVSFEIAAIDKADYMESNDLFNLLVGLQRNPEDAQLAGKVRASASKFTFGDTLRLRTGQGTGAAKPTFDLEPKPTATQPAASGDVTKYTFANLPRRAGIPFATVSATIPVRAFADTPTTRKPGPELLKATPFWPVDDPDVQALAKKITAGKSADADKVKALLDWMLPGKNVKYGGPMGTRYGVKTTMQDRIGRCWDFADLFVALCRAVGVPCREVSGWLYQQSGHVWAEVLLDGKAWRQVDPTGGAAADADYIPFSTTEDGEMPIVYLSMPTIEALDAADR